MPLGRVDSGWLAGLVFVDAGDRERLAAALAGSGSGAPGAGWHGLGHLAGEAPMIDSPAMNWAGSPAANWIAGLAGWSAAEVVLRLMDAGEVIEAVAVTEPWHSPAELYRAMIAGVLQPPSHLTGPVLALLAGFVDAAGPTDDDGILAGYVDLVLTADSLRQNAQSSSHRWFTWDDLRPGADPNLVVSPAICLLPEEAHPYRSLDWLDDINNFDRQAEDPAGLGVDAAGVTPGWLRARIAGGRSPVPLLRVADQPDGSAADIDEDPYGIEVEFALSYKVPADPWSWVEPSDRLRLIGRDLYRLGLTTAPQQLPYHSASDRGYSTAPNTWSFEAEGTIPGGGDWSRTLNADPPRTRARLPRCCGCCVVTRRWLTRALPSTST